jgi:ketosteroid isomerase-like protein
VSSGYAMGEASEVVLLREAYAALNRGDVPGFVRSFDEQVKRFEPAAVPTEGTFRGLAAVTAHVVRGRGTWAEGGCEPERFEVIGNRVIAYIHVRVRVKNESDWREGRAVDVFTFRDGKVVEFRTFFDERLGVEWARGAG